MQLLNHKIFLFFCFVLGRGTQNKLLEFIHFLPLSPYTHFLSFHSTYPKHLCTKSFSIIPLIQNLFQFSRSSCSLRHPGLCFFFLKKCLTKVGIQSNISYISFRCAIQPPLPSSPPHPPPHLCINSYLCLKNLFVLHSRLSIFIPNLGCLFERLLLLQIS